jgi:hypothetical protein
MKIFLDHIDSVVKLIVALAVIISFGVLVYSVCFRVIPEGNRELFAHTLGMVDGAAITIVTFFFGSSIGSYIKNKMLEKKPEESAQP